MYPLAVSSAIYLLTDGRLSPVWAITTLTTQIWCERGFESEDNPCNPGSLDEFRFGETGLLAGIHYVGDSAAPGLHPATAEENIGNIRVLWLGARRLDEILNAGADGEVAGIGDLDAAEE